MQKIKRESSKDSTAHLLNRYLWLLSTIYQNKSISLKEIQEKWQMSEINDTQCLLPRETFRNHKKAIESIFMIDIACDVKNGHKYYIENLEDFEAENYKLWLLNSFSVNNLIKESNKIKERILFENIPSGQKYLSQIIESIINKKEIIIDYESFWSSPKKKLTIQALFLKVFKNRWYLIARIKDSEKIRTYSLDRIKKLTTTDIGYNFSDDFEAKDYFANCFGVISNQEIKAEEIKLKVHIEQVEYFKSLPLHHSQKEIETTEEYSIFQYFLKPTYDFKQEILSHGDNVNIISPISFREEIINTLENTLKLYK